MASGKGKEDKIGATKPSTSIVEVHRSGTCWNGTRESSRRGRLPSRDFTADRVMSVATTIPQLLPHVFVLCHCHVVRFIVHDRSWHNAPVEVTEVPEM